MRRLRRSRTRSACRCGSRPARRISSATREAVVDRGRRRAPVLVQLQADRAGLDLLARAARAGSRCPCRGSRGSSGTPRRPGACAAMCHGPGVQVVAKVPVAGPVPPPIIVVTPDISASSICCGQMKWMCVSMPPGGDDQAFARDHFGARRRSTIVDARLDVGIARLADACDPAVLDADVGLDDAPVIEDQRVGDHECRRPSAARAGSGPCRRGSPCRRRTSPPRRRRCESLLDLDDELGVGEPHAVARGRPEHLGVGAAARSSSRAAGLRAPRSLSSRSCADA